MKSRKVTSFFLILALLLQTAVAPLAVADPTAEDVVRAQQARLDQHLASLPANDEQEKQRIKEARERNRQIADQVIESIRRGVYPRTGAVTPQQWFSLGLTSGNSPLLEVAAVTVVGAPPKTEDVVTALAGNLHQDIDKAVADSKDPAAKATGDEAKHEVDAMKDAVLEAHRKGLLGKLKDIPADQWFRYLLAGGKAIGKAALLAKNNSGLYACATGFGIEVFATALEFPVGEFTQNFPIKTKDMSPTRRFWVASVQQTLWLSTAYNLAVPWIINASAAAHQGVDGPTALTTFGNWGLGALLTFGGALAFRGGQMLENAGRMSSRARNILFAAGLGMGGFMAGVYGLLGGDAATQMAHAAIAWKITGVVTLANLTLAALGLKYGTMDKPGEAKPGERPVNPNDCRGNHAKLVSNG